jgi:hypothetical protein
MAAISNLLEPFLNARWGHRLLKIGMLIDRMVVQLTPTLLAIHEL